MVNVIMQFIARNPPSLLILGAILLYVLGQTDTASTLPVAGVFLQVLRLVLRRR